MGSHVQALLSIKLPIVPLMLQDYFLDNEKGVDAGQFNGEYSETINNYI